MHKTLHLVNATAGKRLAAWLIDRIVPALAVGIPLATALPNILEASGSARQDLLGSLWVALGVGGAIALAYTVWLWGWEATTGKTPGNLALGLRTTSEEGLAAGWGAIFLRGVIIAVSMLIPVVGPIIVVISNLWDRNHQRQGWHDRVGHTLVLDVKAGRDPITTGGLYGPAGFAPGGTVAPGVPGHPDAAPAGASWPAFTPNPGGAISSVPGVSGQPAATPAAQSRAAGTPAPQPRAAQPSAAQNPATAPAGTPKSPMPAQDQAAPASGSRGPASGTAAPTSRSGSASGYRAENVVMVGGAADQADPDVEMGQTQLRAEPQQSGPLVLTFDDQQVHRVSGTALIGRNPAPAAGESVDDLIPYADMGRSVSKTHLHLSVDASGVWVTDRNSTNGSAVTPAGGERTTLEAGRPVLAAPGDTVHFGDRHFTVARG